MFFMFYVLIPIAFQVAKANNLARRTETNLDGKGLTEIKIFSKFKDVRFNDSAPSFKSLFHIEQNISSNKTTSQNLKSNEFDKLLSDEMHSVKQLIYGKEKPKISPPVKQTWPIIELMSKLNKLSETQLVKDYDINMLDNIAKAEETGELNKELENENSQIKSITEITTAKSIATEKTITETSAKTQLYTTTAEIFEEDFIENKQIDEFQNHLQDEQKENQLVDKVISLRSLYDTKRKPVARQSNHGSCCKKTLLPSLSSMRCTAKDYYNKNYANTFPAEHVCTSNKRDTSDYSESTPHICPTENCCHNPGEDCNRPTTCSPPATPSSVTCNSGTTCVTVLTTCYPIYPSTAPIYPSTAPPPTPLIQPYPLPYNNMYQPYQMFVEAPSNNIAEFKEPHEKKHHKHKRYKANKKEYEYYDENYNDYLENDIKTAKPMLVTLPKHKHFKEIVLQDNRNDKCHDGCTRGLYNTDRDKFVNEVIGDLKTYYGDSVIKDCFCFELHSSAASAEFTRNTFILLFLIFYFFMF